MISNQYVAKMLEHALDKDLELLPFLVLGFFCGIRPDGELQKLDWSDVHLTDGTVVIRSEVSKTRRRRFPDLSENAAAWLDAYQQYGGRIVGKVVTFTDSELRTRRKANQIAAGLERWVHQGMRHTFCSNWLALHKDINKLVLMSGHDSVDTMWRHYFKGTTESDVKVFWEIRPPKTIPMPSCFAPMDALERLIDDTQEAPPSKEGLPGEFNRPLAKTKSSRCL